MEVPESFLWSTAVTAAGVTLSDDVNVDAAASRPLLSLSSSMLTRMGDKGCTELLDNIGGEDAVDEVGDVEADDGVDT